MLNLNTANVHCDQRVDVDATSTNRDVSVAIICCESRYGAFHSVRAVATAIESIASTQVFILSNDKASFPDVRVVQVPDGTKLSKLCHFSKSVESDFICICDPDLEINQLEVKAVFEQAFDAAGSSREIVAYGLVNCRSNGTLLSRVIAVDKWLSHRVLRPALWRCRIGITIPGQFLVLSTSVLQRLQPAIDSYLDDLYLGWIARSTNVNVLRIPVVVGQEESRNAFSSLLLQRLRWMRGFFALLKHLSNEPRAIALLLTHFVAYHAIPIIWLICLLYVAAFYPIAAFIIFVIAGCTTGLLSGQPLTAAFSFTLVFPLLHCLATLLWWIPISRKRLTQR